MMVTYSSCIFRMLMVDPTGNSGENTNRRYRSAESDRVLPLNSQTYPKVRFFIRPRVVVCAECRALSSNLV